MRSWLLRWRTNALWQKQLLRAWARLQGQITLRYMADGFQGWAYPLLSMRPSVSVPVIWPSHLARSLCEETGRWRWAQVLHQHEEAEQCATHALSAAVAE